MPASAKGKQQQCIEHTPYYLRDCRVHIFPTTFLEIDVYGLLLYFRTSM